MQLILEWVLSDVSCVLWCLPKSPSPEDALSQRLFLVVWEHSWGRETRDSMAKPLTWNLLCGLQQVPLLLWAWQAFFFFFFFCINWKTHVVQSDGQICCFCRDSGPTLRSLWHCSQLPVQGACHILQVLSVKTTSLLLARCPKAHPIPSNS